MQPSLRQPYDTVHVFFRKPTGIIMSSEFKFIRYEGVTNGVANIALARPDKRKCAEQNHAL